MNIFWREDPREPSKLIGSVNGLDLFAIFPHVADTFMLGVCPTRSPVIGAPRNDPFASGGILDHHEPLLTVAEAKAIADLKLRDFLYMLGAIFKDDAARLYKELDAAAEAWVSARDFQRRAVLGSDARDAAEQEAWDRLLEIKKTLGLCTMGSCRAVAVHDSACEEHRLPRDGSLPKDADEVTKFLLQPRRGK